jgi:hypothetical protein
MPEPKKEDEDDEAFLRSLVLPEEDRIRRRVWTGGFRWFRSPNIVPLERYQALREWKRLARDPSGIGVPERVHFTEF